MKETTRRSLLAAQLHADQSLKNDQRVTQLEQSLSTLTDLITRLVTSTGTDKPHNSTSTTTAPIVVPPPRVELFGVPTPAAIGHAPVYKNGEPYTRWRNLLEGYAGQFGLLPLVTMPATESWDRAKQLNHKNVELSQLWETYKEMSRRVHWQIWGAILQSTGVPYELAWRDGSADDVVVLDNTFTLQPDENPYRLVLEVQAVMDRTSKQAAYHTLQRLVAIRWDTKTSGATHLSTFNQLTHELGRLIADDKPAAGEPFGPQLTAFMLLSTLPSSMSTDVKILLSQDTLRREDIEAVIRRVDEPAGSNTNSKQQPQVEKANALVQVKNKKNHNNKSKNKGKGKGGKKTPKPTDEEDEDADESKAMRPDNTGQRMIACLFESPPPPLCLEAQHLNMQLPVDDTQLNNEMACHASFEDIYSARFNDAEPESICILDSGASRHMWSQMRDVTDIRDLPEPVMLTPAVGPPVWVKKAGTVRLSEYATISNVALMPRGRTNLISVSRIIACGYIVSFDSSGAYIASMARPKQYLIKFKLKDGVYYRDLFTNPKFVDTEAKQGDGFRWKTPTPAERERNKTPTRHSSVVTKNVAKPSSSTSTPATKQQPASSQKPAKVAYMHAAAYALRETPTHGIGTASPTSVDPDLLKHLQFGHSTAYPYSGCETCLATRTRRKAVTSKPYQSASAPMQTLCADLLGPVSIVGPTGRQRLPSMGKNIYALIVLDEFTRYVHIRLLKTKSDAAGALITLLTLLKRQHGSEYPILRFHSDGGGEFSSEMFRSYLASEGIVQTMTTRGHPQHNGKCERVNQTLMAIVRSTLHHAGAHPLLWGECLLHAARTYNYTPLKVIGGVSPHEKLTKQAPPVQELHAFGTDVYLSVDDTKLSKIQPTSVRGTWIGLDSVKNGHRILIDSRLNILVSRDVKFVEGRFQHLQSIVPYGDDDNTNNTLEFNQEQQLDEHETDDSAHTTDGNFIPASYST